MKVPRISLNLRRLDAADADFAQQLDQLLQFEASHEEAVEGRVKTILAGVRARGDAACRYKTNSTAARPNRYIPSNYRSSATAGGPRAFPAHQAAALQQAAERVQLPTSASNNPLELYRRRRQYSRAKSHPSTELASMCPAARRLIPRRCLKRHQPKWLGLPGSNGQAHHPMARSMTWYWPPPLWRVLSGSTASVAPKPSVPGLRHANDSQSGQNSRPWQHLCGHRQTRRIRPGGYRHDRGPPDPHRRWLSPCRLAGHGFVLQANT